MKSFGLFILIGGILLIIWVLQFIISSQTPSRVYRKDLSQFSAVYTFTDTSKFLISPFRSTNYHIKTKPIYSYDNDEDLENDKDLENENEEYDRSYFGSNFKGGSYSGGK